MMEQIITGVAIVVIGGIITIIARHVSNSDKHPSKKDIVFRDVCDKTHEGLNDCIEGKIERLDQKVDLRCDQIEKNLIDFKKDVKTDMGEIKELIRNHG